MAIYIFVLKGDLNGKIVVVRFFFCRVYFIVCPYAVGTLLVGEQCRLKLEAAKCGL